MGKKERWFGLSLPCAPNVEEKTCFRGYERCNSEHIELPPPLFFFQNQTSYFENVANRFSLCYGFDVVSSGALITSNGDV